MLQRHFAGLWHHADFLRLWTGQTISVFGSLVGATAIGFTAILVLHATPFQLGVLAAVRLAPGFLTGLIAGAWVGHVSVQTTERYLGCKQRLRNAVNDHIGLESE